MTTNRSSRRELSPALYGRLDTELLRAQTKNRQQPASPATAGDALGALVAQRLLEDMTVEPQSARERFEEWAGSEVRRAAAGWRRNGLASNVPGDLGVLTERHKTAASALHSLFDATQALEQSQLRTTDGQPAAWNMHLVLLPWRTLYERELLGLRDQWYVPLSPNPRSSSAQQYSIREEISYRVDSKRSMSVKEHLERKLQQDGDWGMMLVLNPTQEVDSLQGRAAEQLRTKNPFVIGGYRVDALGFSEWQALMAQEAPDLPRRTGVWLPANNVQGESRNQMSYGVSNYASFGLFTPSAQQSAPDAHYCLAIEPTGVTS